MKQLIIASALLAAATTQLFQSGSKRPLLLVDAQDIPLTHADQIRLYGPFGPYRTNADLNNTIVCKNAALDFTRFNTDTSAWSYSIDTCTVACDTLVNVSGTILPILYSHVPDVPVGLVCKNTKFGMGSALVVQGPNNERARVSMAWFVDINWQLIRGARPPPHQAWAPSPTTAPSPWRATASSAKPPTCSRPTRPTTRSWRWASAGRCGASRSRASSTGTQRLTSPTTCSM